MNPYRKDPTKAAMVAAASALVILLAGCQTASPKEPSYTVVTMSPQPDRDDTPDSPQKTYSETADNELQKIEPHLNRADTSSDTSAETSTFRQENDTKAQVKTQSEDAEWAADNPSLYGVAIGDHDSVVSKLHGKPLDSYKLEEETEPITVLEYDGFAVGINAYKHVQYIEVYGKDISAGLSGLQIGDKTEAALLALGKPEKQTAYLLTFKAKDALLKLDLDPTHNLIVSIKLLALN
ncbi:hypothetical protein [Candidatus Pristimantibacillus sp. PTI5]|uniref:hypothetical protein n=1 Tax=Candidatus Pristimantibacillus sp. PTI5 TaxID=3400422 RepID=UPI003B01173F